MKPNIMHTNKKITIIELDGKFHKFEDDESLSKFILSLKPNTNFIMYYVSYFAMMHTTDRKADGMEYIS